MQTRLISESQIRELISMKEVIEAVDKTFAGYANGTVVNPTKVTLDMGESAPYPAYGSFMNAMPAYIGWTDMAGLKWAGGFDERKAGGRPWVSALMYLVDPRQGDFLAVMDATYITAVRTGAQNAVGVMHYLKGRKSIKLGVCGAGVQGHMQTWAISEVFDISQVKVFDVYRPAAEKYKADMQQKIKGDIIIVDSPKEVCDADVVICVTVSKTPIIHNADVKPGTIVCPIGSYQEVDDEFILSADKIIIDHLGQCFHRGLLAKLAGEGKLKESDIFATLGEICNGTKSVGDVSGQRIISCPIGMGALDVAVASIVYQRAVEKGIGGSFNFHDCI